MGYEAGPHNLAKEKLAFTLEDGEYPSSEPLPDVFIPLISKPVKPSDKSMSSVGIKILDYNTGISYF